MKKLISYILTLAGLVLAFVFSGMRSSNTDASVTFIFSNYVGDKLLILDSAHYKNELGQDFTVSNFKYYISNIQLRNEKGKTVFMPGYFLIKADDSTSFHFVAGQIPAGKYFSLSFMIGVDSLHNCSGAQSGALDPANGMFWAWNSGYIFMKLEGKAATSKSPAHIFEYHIGGYKEPAACIRTVTIDLKNSPLIVSPENSSRIFLKTDIAEILKTPTTIDFSKLSSVTDFHHATEIADNYKDMFSVLKVENEK